MARRPDPFATSHWSGYDPRWRRITPPLRVTTDVAAAYQAVVRTSAGRVLLLGATAELADVTPDLVAIDRSEARVRHRWPGNTEHRRAFVGDWLEMALRDRSGGAAIGDGILNIFEYPAGPRRILDEVARVLRPGAPVAIRVFSRPEREETLAEIRADARAGRIQYFQAFKLRLAMALAATERDSPNVPVRVIRDVFDREFPDRAALAADSGWSVDDIATIDLYENSPDVYCFPIEQQLASLVPSTFANVRFVRVGSYELAERCPLLVAERR